MRSVTFLAVSVARRVNPAALAAVTKTLLIATLDVTGPVVPFATLPHNVHIIRLGISGPFPFMGHLR